jgi:CHAD domain-containing protein
VSFRFEPDQPVPDEARRVLLEQIRVARASLAAVATPTAIHETRKACKRARAALDLLKEGLGAEAIEPLRTILRDAARTIGPVRDADVLGALVTKMELHVAVDEPVDRAARLAAAADALAQAEELALALDTTELQPPLLLSGLTRAWAKARKAHQKARRSRDPGAVHEWRKATKRLLHQIELLDHVAPALDGLRKLVDDLQHQLGDHHDLSVLHNVAGGDEPASQVLEGKAADLEDRALAAGDLMFAAKRKTFDRWLRATILN